MILFGYRIPMAASLLLWAAIWEIVGQANVIEEIRKLKQQPGGDIRILGSATLVQSLMQEGLIDEYRLMVHPLVLGRGKRLFSDGMETTRRIRKLERALGCAQPCRVVALTAAGGRPTKVAVIELKGHGGPPKARLTGPGGRSVAVPAGSEGVQTDQALVVADF